MAWFHHKDIYNLVSPSKESERERPTVRCMWVNEYMAGIVPLASEFHHWLILHYLCNDRSGI